MLEEERREGQTFLFDLELDVDAAGAQTDDLAGTVDYREIVACVRRSPRPRVRAARGARHGARRRAAGALRRSRVRVRVRKPEVQLEAPVDYTAVTVEELADVRQEGEVDVVARDAAAE